MLHIDTSRLILRDFVEADWRAMHSLGADPAVTRFQTYLPMGTEEETRDWLRRAIFHNNLQPRDAYNLAIVRRGDGTVVGWIGFGGARDHTLGDHNFGYALDRRYWGRGYATEALRALLAYAFAHAGVRTIFGTCVAANPASARVMEKAGLRLAARGLTGADRPGPAEEELRYRVTREAWSAWHHRSRPGTDNAE
jgi:RimJ/RimL family protein N-acetyltransferase